MIRMGLMGAGTVASYGHLPGMAEVKEIEIASVFDPNPANLKAAQ